MFTKKARELSTPYWEGSFYHPFIRELQEGTLSDEAFRYYLIQDRYYLEHFSKLHQLIAEQVDDKEVKEMLLTGATHLKEGEMSIRADFFKELDITDEEISHTAIAPTAYHYVSHMYRQLVDGTPNSAVAGLLPCAWLYQEIGEALIKTGSPHPLYQRWIETYASEESKEDVLHQCHLLNKLYETSDETEQEKMIEAFYVSTQMEYLFWDMAYTHQMWPEGETDVI